MKLHGHIVDAKTRAPLGDTIVTSGALCVVTDRHGAFALEVPLGLFVLHLEKEGHRVTDVPVSTDDAQPLLLSMEPMALPEPPMVDRYEWELCKHEALKHRCPKCKDEP